MFVRARPRATTARKEVYRQSSNLRLHLTHHVRKEPKTLAELRCEGRPSVRLTISNRHDKSDQEVFSSVACESRRPIVCYYSTVELGAIREMAANLAAILSPLSPYRKSVT